jgi:predicted alpha-1,6-mannanase (GH76 family)
MMIRGRLWSRTVVTGALVAAALPLAVTSATASPDPAAANVAVTPQQAGIDVLMKSYSNNLIGDDWWQAAVAQSTLETYEQATGDTTYFPDIADTYNAYNANDHVSTGFPDFEDHYADDTAWWALAWLQAYNLTGNTAYLQTAEDAANYIDQHFADDDAAGCGKGGVYWWDNAGSTDPLAGQFTIENALFIELTAGLHEAIPGDTKFLGWASSTWSWMDASGLIQSSGLVYNGWNGDCQLTGPYWTYNQGSVIAALATLYQATGNSSLITEAEKVASGAIAALAPDGILAETCEPSSCDGDQLAFKGIFVRDLKLLATVAGTSQYNSFFAAQAASIEDHDTDAAGQSGLVWSAPLSTCSATQNSSGVFTGANPCNPATQASAVEALVAAFVPPARPSAVADTNGTVRVFARAAGGGVAGGSVEEDSLTAGSSTWSGFTSLGGGTPYSPAAVAASNGDTWVFLTGANGVLYGDRLPAGSSTWSGWSSEGKPAPMDLVGTPAVVQDHTGAIRVFVRGMNGNLYTDSLSGSTWSGFSDLSGIWPSDVGAFVAGGGFTRVFAVGTTANLYQDVLDPGHPWSGWANLGGSVTGVPAALVDSTGTFRAYARTTSGGALEEYHESSGTLAFGLDSRGGTWPYDSAAVPGQGEHVVLLFEVGTSGSLNWQYLTPAPSWSAWLSLGGSFTGVPVAVALGSGAVDLFADSGGTLEVSQLAAGASTWSAWSALGGGVAA